MKYLILDMPVRWEWKSKDGLMEIDVRFDLSQNHQKKDVRDRERFETSYRSPPSPHPSLTHRYVIDSWIKQNLAKKLE